MAKTQTKPEYTTALDRLEAEIDEWIKTDKR